MSLWEYGGRTRCETGGLNNGLGPLYLGLVKGCRKSGGLGCNARVVLQISGHELSIRLDMGGFNFAVRSGSRI